ncbi:MAG: transposase [Burkholderia sp.]
MLEPDPVCPKCGTEMQVLGEDVSEQLARVAAAFKVIRTIRRKMLCPGCGHIEQPPMPGLPIERSIAHPSALADIVVSKFADHQPLYRQAEIAARNGVTLDRASMGCWVGQIAVLCKPLIEAIQRYTLRPGKLHTDDTPVAARARLSRMRYGSISRRTAKASTLKPGSRHSAGGCYTRPRSTVREHAELG